MLYLWYIDSSCDRNKIHNYATFKEYFHVVQLAKETMLSLSEMYHDTFTNRKKYNFLCRRLIKKSDRLN